MQMLVQNKTANTNGNEADNILAGVAEDAGALILKFNHQQGVYETRDEPVVIGSQFLAHTAAWQKVWTHFAPDGNVIDQKIFVVKDCREKVPKREELGDDDKSKWSIKDGQPLDPWLYQYYLPLEKLETGEILVFVTRSDGGMVAVQKLCAAYAKRLKSGQDGLPIVKLGTASFGRHGALRPDFETVRGDEDNKADPAAAIPVQPAAPKKKVAVAGKSTDLDDEIPY
jgi:hypothetical protein